ncbi:MAG: CatB-related O-acetyltransferase [Clostridiales bacterium]|nr:CatB-related O-acetyltransferase [Clostridiales bacterium]
MNLRFVIAKIIEKTQIAALKNCTVDKRSKVCSRSRAYDTVINRYSYVGSNCTVINTVIGKYCSIADGCIIGGPQHHIDYVSSSPVFHEGRNSMKKVYYPHPAVEPPVTVIGNDVWLGNNVIIKGGCTIGNGAVVGMGSVVTHDIPDYEVWAGNPARPIRKRFDDETIRFLSDIRWWDWEEEKIEKYAKYFNDPAALKAALEEEK